MPWSTSAYDEAMSLTAKLHPDRFTAMSPKMTAIIAYVLGEAWTDPHIGWMSVSSDGYATTDSDFLGDAADLDRNIRKLLIAAVVGTAFGRTVIVDAFAKQAGKLLSLVGR